MSNWYKWDSIESFNTWHEVVKIELGLPQPSVKADGTEVVGGIITNNYTIPVIVAKNDVRAIVEDDNAQELTLSVSPSLTYKTELEIE